MKTIAYITDIHMNEGFPKSIGIDAKGNWSRMLQHLEEKGIKHIVFGGDIGDVSAHDHFFESLTNFSYDLILGNHDQQEFETFTKAGTHGHHYHYDDDSYRYIILDSSAGHITPEQLSWLEEAVKTQKKIVLFVHHPILAVPCYVETHYALKDREVIRQILQKTKHDITIFCGHYHLEDERTEENIRQMVTPALSYQMVKSVEKAIDNTQFGGRLIHISPEQIDTELITFKNN